MTEELKQAAQAALEQLEFLNACYPHKTATDAADALRRALTQRPAAQGLPELVQWHKEQAHGWRHAAMTSAADKVEPCRSSLLHMADFHESAAQAIASLPAPQQATPEPLMPDQQSALKQALFKSARIVEQATPEPVGGPVGTVVHAKLNGQAKPWVTVALNQDADLPDGAELYTHPAPGVPESPRQLRKRFEQHMRDVFACKDTAFLSIDGGKTYLDGSMDNHWRTWLAAQAKGGA